MINLFKCIDSISMVHLLHVPEAHLFSIDHNSNLKSRTRCLVLYEVWNLRTQIYLNTSFYQSYAILVILLTYSLSIWIISLIEYLNETFNLRKYWNSIMQWFIQCLNTVESFKFLGSIVVDCMSIFLAYLKGYNFMDASVISFSKKNNSLKLCFGRGLPTNTTKIQRLRFFFWFHSSKLFTFNFLSPY